MVVDKRLTSFANVRAALTIPVIPFQYAINAPARVIDNLGYAITNHDSLVAENTQLKQDKLILMTRLQRLVALENENNYLRSLMQSADKAKGRTLIAELMAIDSEPFVHQVTIDKGVRDGLYVGQPVLDSDGVMGQVTAVNNSTSRVLLINDSHSGVSVQNVRSGIRSVVSGDNYSDKLRLLFVPKTADVRAGDMFLTSGLGDHYPEGYPVGKVVAVNRDPGKQFADVYLQPSAHLDTSRQVLLIWNKK